MEKEIDWQLKVVAEEHNNLNKSYFDNNTTDTYPSFLKLKEAFQFIQSNDTVKSILDIGCGAAWQALYLQKNNLLDNINYTGIDISKEMLIHASQNFPAGNFICTDILKSNVVKKYDVVMESAFVELFHDWQNTVERIIAYSSKWIVLHRMAFTENSFKTKEVNSYNNSSHLVVCVGLKQLKEVAKDYNLVWSGIYPGNEVGTFILKKI